MAVLKYTPDDGVTWLPVAPGPKGNKGDKGDQGEVVVGTTTTAPPGSPAKVTDVDPLPGRAVLDFELPAGEPTTLFVQPAPPDTSVHPDGYPLWLDTDEEPGGIPLVEYEDTNDLLYERKSELLKEASWWVDAGAVGYMGDRLVDLSGNGRDAMFGAGAAAPVVLPWSGEDYIHIPTDQPGVNTAYINTADWTASVEWEVDFESFAGKNFFFGGEGYWNGGFEGNGTNMYVSMGSQQVNIGAQVNGRNKWKVTLTTTTYTVLLNGSAFANGNWVATANHLPPTSLYPFLGMAATFKYNVYRVVIRNDGVEVAVMDPRNVSADYSKIKNPSGLGGDWVISRPASGMKLAVVDRPLLLSNAQTLITAALPRIRYGTIITTMQGWGASNEYAFGHQPWGDYSNGLQAAQGDGGYTYAAIIKDGDDNSNVSAVSSGVLGRLVLAVRWSGAALEVLVNGVVRGRDTAVIAADLIDNALVYRSDMEFANGAIFDRVLTDAEVAQVSAELAGTTEPGTVLITHPNVDDVLVQVYDGPKARWQTVHYDSGWRNCVSLLNAGVSTAYEGMKVRRVNDQVTLLCGFSVVAGWVAGAIATLPAGFYPTAGNDQRQPACSGAPTAMHALFSNGDLYLETGFAGMAYRTNVVAHGCGPIPTSLPGTLISPAPAYALPGSI
jgi:hypothetical protein